MPRVSTLIHISLSTCLIVIYEIPLICLFYLSHSEITIIHWEIKTQKLQSLLTLELRSWNICWNVQNQIGTRLCVHLYNQLKNTAKTLCAAVVQSIFLRLYGCLTNLESMGMKCNLQYEFARTSNSQKYCDTTNFVYKSEL